MLFLLCVSAVSLAAAVPADFTAALARFHTDGPVGWSFTRTTTSGEKALTEHFDGGKPEFERWSLISTENRTPTDAEIRDYMQRVTRRSAGDRPPRLMDQVATEDAETLADDAKYCVMRFKMKRGEEADKTAAFLRVTVSFEKKTGTIDRVTITNTEPFSPLFGVKISEMKTEMTYNLPTETLPSLLQEVTTRVRGRAFFRSMDEDMSVVYSDYKWAGKGKPTGVFLKPST